jgi:hypothetical protein
MDMEDKVTELEKIEPKIYSLKIAGKDREIKFNFSAWREIEKKYGSVNNVQQLVQDMSEKPFQTLPEIVYMALVDKEGVTAEDCLNDYTMVEMKSIVEIVSEALKSSLPSEFVSKKKVKKPQEKTE